MTRIWVAGDRLFMPLSPVAPYVFNLSPLAYILLKLVNLAPPKGGAKL